MKKIITVIGLIIAGMLAFAEPVHITVTNTEDICAEDMIYFLAEAEYDSTFTVKVNDENCITVLKTDKTKFGGYCCTYTVNGKTEFYVETVEEVLVGFNCLCQQKGM